MPHEQWNTVESSHYWLEGEKPICVLKSVNQEFAFTGTLATAGAAAARCSRLTHFAGPRLPERATPVADRAIYFLVTHDIDTLRAITDRIVVLVNKKLVIGNISELRKNKDPWIQDYFSGVRGRAALADMETR